MFLIKIKLFIVISIYKYLIIYNKFIQNIKYIFQINFK